MKNILSLKILILIFLTQSFFTLELKAQSIKLTGDNYVSGNPVFPVASYIVVKNLTSDSIDVQCQKNIIDTAAGTENYFCWGINCWPSTTYVSPIPDGVRTIPPGYADSSNFTAYYDAAPLGIISQERAVVEYCFYPVGNISDSTCLTVHFNDNSNSINEIGVEIGLQDFYPNPSNGKISSFYKGAKNCQLHILDILGNQIKTYKLDNSGTIEINTNLFESGIYFANLIRNNKLLDVKKFIVN